MKKVTSVSSGGNGSHYGVKTMKTVGEFFILLMENQRRDRLSDEDLAEKMKEEFPNRARKDSYLRDIRFYRSRYNNGKWPIQNSHTPDFIVPKYVGGKPQVIHPGPKSKREGEE